MSYPNHFPSCAKGSISSASRGASSWYIARRYSTHVMMQMHHEQLKAAEDVDFGDGDDEPVADCTTRTAIRLNAFPVLCTLPKHQYSYMAFTLHLVCVCVCVCGRVARVGRRLICRTRLLALLQDFCLPRFWTMSWYMRSLSGASRRREWAPKRPCKGARYKGCIHACGCLACPIGALMLLCNFVGLDCAGPKLYALVWVHGGLVKELGTREAFTTVDACLYGYAMESPTAGNSYALPFALLLHSACPTRALVVLCNCIGLDCAGTKRQRTCWGTLYTDMLCGTLAWRDCLRGGWAQSIGLWQLKISSHCRHLQQYQKHKRAKPVACFEYQ